MPLFNFSNPFDAMVEKVTNERNTTEDWALIMEICDSVGRQKNGARDCLKSIVKRLNHKVPFVVLQALTLLDSCMKNCGRIFHLEVCSRDFMLESRKLTGQKTHPKVAQKMRFLIKKWSEIPEIKNDKSLNLMPALYEALKREGADFSNPDTSIKAVNPLAAQTMAAREDDDVAKAIALSLEQAEKVEQAKQSGGYPSTVGCTPIYPTIAPTGILKNPEPEKHVTFGSGGSLPTKVLYSVRALYDFEAVEDNELTFKAGELISVTDDSDANWWKGFNSRSEGLFPTNFVTADLSVEPDNLTSDGSAGLIGASAVTEPEKVEINELLINETLALLQNADPTGECRPDNPEMLRMEAMCQAMGPLIDCQLQSVDKECTQMLELNFRLREALQMYYSLMKENPAYCASTKPPGPLVLPPGMGQPVYGVQQTFYGIPPPAAMPPPGQTPFPAAPPSASEPLDVGVTNPRPDDSEVDSTAKTNGRTASKGKE